MPSAVDKSNFLSNAQLLAWINSTLSLGLQKIEETCNGSIACQLMDCCQRERGGVSLKEVDFNASTEMAMLKNYSVLERAFTKYAVQKNIESLKLVLIKGKPQASMEFMQWFKGYFDSVTNYLPITDYDGQGRRATSKTGDATKMGSRPNPNAKPSPSSSSIPAPPATSTSPAAAPSKASPSAATIPSKTSPSVPAKKEAAPSPSLSTPSTLGQPTPLPPTAAAPPEPRVSAPNGPSPREMHLAAELAEARAVIDLLDKEKTFYYCKLRDVELLCQTPKLADTPILQKILSILFAPTIEEGRQRLIETQTQFTGRTFLEEDEAESQAFDNDGNYATL